MEALVAETGANELMVVSDVYGPRNPRTMSREHRFHFRAQL